MRTPPDNTAKCEVCGEPLDYEIGSIAWQCRDNDYCGTIECYKPKCKVFTFSSRVCELGTKSCTVYHKDLKE